MWSKNFTFHESYASYHGSVDTHELHHHAAIQIVFSLHDSVHVSSDSDTRLIGPGFLIRPLVNHKIECDSDVAIIFLEPQSFISFEVLNYIGPGDIEPLTIDFLSKINIKKEHSQWMDNFRTTQKTELKPLDERLLYALNLLQSHLGVISISNAAKQVGLSESRLRTLAREQIGVPISTWLIWRKLNKSANELALGSSLVDAAMAGGFADQAHFTRSMKRMFGISPKTATIALESE